MIQLKVEKLKTTSGATIEVVDAAELYEKLNDKRPFALWFASYSRGLPKLVEGENIFHRMNDKKQTLISREIASKILMMSHGPDAREYRQQLIEIDELFSPAGSSPPGFEWILKRES